MTAAINQTDNGTVSYQDLIREAFISPIRNVTVIDDEYPTLNGYLSGKLEKKQQKEINRKRLQSIIEMCHTKHKWSVDVYDGCTPQFGAMGQQYAEYINHSDLLVLDYHLDGEPDNDDGQRSRNILQQLSNNNYFNLVIVHTKGHSNNIDDVYNAILKDFIAMPEYLKNAEQVDFEELLAEYQDSLDEESSIELLLKVKIELRALIKWTKNQKLALNTRNPNHPLHAYNDDIDTFCKGGNVEQQAFVTWLLVEQFSAHKVDAAKKITHQIQWDFDDTSNYIATGKIFITVIHKEDEEPQDKLHNELLKALTAHNPSPMLLLMAKIRNELDDKGFAQANIIMENKPAQAGWLYNLLEKADQKEAIHHEAIDRHWEQLASESKKPLIEFSKRIVESLKSDNSKATVKSYFQDAIKDKSQVLAHLNAYACSKPVAQDHLTTGTILTNTINGQVEYWLCLSPACDLVPKQRIKLWQDRLDEHYLPFKAIQLIKDDCGLAAALKKVNENEYIFIEIDEQATPLHLKFANGNPKWETFYAHNQGYFDNAKQLKVNCMRAEKAVDSEERQDKTPPKLESAELTMTAITELRYEYALNLLQQFSSNQSRVGLNFVDSVWK